MPIEYDLICFSHLRWDFVYQRPQHLIGRIANKHRAFYWEEPVFNGDAPALDVSSRPEGVTVLTPHLPPGRTEPEHHEMQHRLFADFMRRNDVRRYVLWLYSPMFYPLTADLKPLAVVYDCMDELSAFAGAPPELREHESALMERADLVFTGGQSLYEAKRGRHRAVYAFPSSVDVPHFAQARTITEEPADQAALPHPRLGFYGVIDERLDVNLLAAVAELRPDYQWVLIGPTVPKIDAATLPRHPNIHYLGMKGYGELPSYVAGWDVALLPFALNESTRFISPTKTPEYLAAGRPVVSTPIRDVVRPYGELKMVRIAATAEEFVTACDAALCEDAAVRQQKADAFLADMSWDNTWSRMAQLVDAAVEKSDPRGPRTEQSAAGAI